MSHVDAPDSPGSPLSPFSPFNGGLVLPFTVSLSPSHDVELAMFAARSASVFAVVADLPAFVA